MVYSSLPWSIWLNLIESRWPCLTLQGHTRDQRCQGFCPLKFSDCFSGTTCLILIMFVTQHSSQVVFDTHSMTGAIFTLSLSRYAFCGTRQIFWFWFLCPTYGASGKQFRLNLILILVSKADLENYLVDSSHIAHLVWRVAITVVRESLVFG